VRSGLRHGPSRERRRGRVFRSPELLDYLRDARAIHRLLCTTVHQLVTRAGLNCRSPQAAFYPYPQASFTTKVYAMDVDLAADLLERHGITVLPGSAFGDEPTDLRFRISTSLLCGTSHRERWETIDAFRSGELLSLPRITHTLEGIEAALADIAGART
jgi:aspartate aminotransferase